MGGAREREGREHPGPCTQLLSQLWSNNLKKYRVEKGKNQEVKGIWENLNEEKLSRNKAGYS